MFGGVDSGQVQSSNSDDAIETLITLLVPPGWIPAADGAISVLGAVLMCWGPSSSSSSSSSISPHGDGGGASLILPGGTNQKAVRSSVLQIIYWLFDAFPLQTLAALLQVWDTEMSVIQKGTSMRKRRLWRCQVSGLPSCCSSIVEVMLEVGRHYPEEERVLQKCMELIVQLVRRKKNDMSFKFKFTEASVRQFCLSYLAGRSTVDPSLRLVPSVTDTLKEAVASSDDPVAVLGLLQLFDAYMKRLPALSDKKHRRALQECLHLMVNASLSLADMSLGPKAKSTFSIVGGDAGVGTATTSSTSGGDAGGSSGGGVDQNNIMSRRRTGLDALEALSEHLASLLEKCWKDGEERVEMLLLSGDLGSQRDRFAPLIAKAVLHLKPIIRARTSSMMLHAGAAVKVLASLNHPMFVKLWRKDVLELFQDSDFFQMGSSAEHHWLNLVDVVMSQEAGAFTDLLGTSPLNAVFKLNMIGQENNKYRQHADYIKRLAFVLLAGDVDQYLAGMHEILEKLVEALRLPPSEPAIARIYKTSFLCMRVLLLRISSPSLVSFWPIVLSEVSRILRMSSSRDADMDVCYAALRFLDLLITLEPEEFLLMKWAFVFPHTVDEDNDHSRSFLFSPATQTLASEMKSKMDPSQLASYFAVDADGASSKTGGRVGTRRPLLQRLEVMSREELCMASMLLATSSVVGDVVESRNPDIDFIFHAIRREFDEFHDVTQLNPSQPDSNGHETVSQPPGSNGHETVSQPPGSNGQETVSQPPGSNGTGSKLRVEQERREIGKMPAEKVRMVDSAVESGVTGSKSVHRLGEKYPGLCSHVDEFGTGMRGASDVVVDGFKAPLDIEATSGGATPHCTNLEKGKEGESWNEVQSGNEAQSGKEGESWNEAQSGNEAKGKLVVDVVEHARTQSEMLLEAAPACATCATEQLDVFFFVSAQIPPQQCRSLSLKLVLCLHHDAPKSPA